MMSLRLIVVVLLVAACAGPTTTAQPTSSRTGEPTAPAAHGETVQPTAGSTPPPTVVGPTPDTTAQTSSAPPADLTIAAEPLAEVDAPLIFFTSDGAGGHYAVGQDGIIYVVELDGSAQAEPYLDISDRIVSGGEQGLLGLAFHPDFVGNGRLFVNYTDTDGDTVVSEFREVRPARNPSDNVVDAQSERVLLTIQQPFDNHNGGMIAFGPDGYLYIGMGDGGSAGDPMGNGQAAASLLGKMLRIDINSGDPYAIPAANPFVADGSGLPEIWSLGWRNPWRFSFDVRGSGALFVGDVGQRDVEEIDIEPRGDGGRNYGWNTMEGDLCFRTDTCDQTGLTLPVVSNHRERGECAIIGGYVYRGATYPEMQGTYFYSDNCTGDIWAFDADAALESGAATPALVGSADIRPRSFGEDDKGELYLVNGSGGIFRLVAERVRP